MNSRLPTVLYGATWAGLIVMLILFVLLFVLIFATGMLSISDLRWAFPDASGIGEVSRLQGSIALAVGLIPWAAVGAAGWHLQSLFQLFREDQALSFSAANRIRKVGFWLVVVAVSKPIVGALQVLILTISNPPGERSIAVSLSFAEFGFLIAGGLMVVIGHALADAARAVEETRGFV